MLALASCSRQALDESAVMQSISASGLSTRTVLDGKKVLWESGDALSVFDGVSNCRFTTSDSGENAVFDGLAVDRDNYYVLYPYNSSATFSGTDITTELQSVQTATNGSFADGANLAAAISTKVGDCHKAAVYNVGCFFKFVVEKTESGITGVELQAIGGEDLSGSVTLGFDNDGVPYAVSGMNGNTVCFANGGVLSPGIYWLVSLPGTLSEGLRITVTTLDGSTSYDFAGMSSLQRNQIYTIGQSLDYPLLAISHEGVLEDQVLVSSTHEGLEEGYNVSKWASWTDAESVRTLMLKAADEGKVYFTDYKYYNYESYDSLRGKCLQYGYPLMFSADLFKASSSYFPAEQTAKIRGNLISVIKKAWAKSRCLPALSWHIENPYADYEKLQGAAPARYFYGSADYPDYPVSQRYVVRHILNNTNGQGDWFDERCRDVAGIINSLVDENGKPIPVIFRLFHELEHNWAWWQLQYYKAGANTTVAEYKELFRLAVTKIRTYCPEAEILFCYNYDRSFGSKDVFLRAYPGDDYVDIMSYDDYAIGNRSKVGTKEETISAMLTRSRIVSDCASEHGKIAALFETNNNSTDEEDQRTFYNEYLRALLDDPKTSLSFVGTWAVNISGDVRKAAFEEFINESDIIFAE